MLCGVVVFSGMAQNALADTVITVPEINAPADVVIYMPITFAQSDDRPVSTLAFHVTFPVDAIHVEEVLPTPELTEKSKAIDYELHEDGMTMAFFGGVEALPDGIICYLLLRVDPDTPSAVTLPVSSAATYGASAAAAPVSVQFNPGHIHVLAAAEKHSADTTKDWRITLSELVRVVQLYNAGSYHCNAAGVDGYAPGPGDQDCMPHDADYAPADWRIGFSELLRMIQLYNSPLGMYHVNPNTEDGFAPGPFGFGP